MLGKTLNPAALHISIGQANIKGIIADWHLGMFNGGSAEGLRPVIDVIDPDSSSRFNDCRAFACGRQREKTEIIIVENLEMSAFPTEQEPLLKRLSWRYPQGRMDFNIIHFIC